jgi:hypothetical protein
MGVHRAYAHPRHLLSSAMLLRHPCSPTRSLSSPAFFSWIFSHFLAALVISSRLASHLISSSSLLLITTPTPPDTLSPLGLASPQHILIFRSTHSTAQHILPFPSSFLASLPGPTSSIQSTSPYTHFHPTRLARVALRPPPFSFFVHTYIPPNIRPYHPSVLYIPLRPVYNLLSSPARSFLYSLSYLSATPSFLLHSLSVRPLHPTLIYESHFVGASRI